MSPEERIGKGKHGSGADELCGDNCARIHFVRVEDAIRHVRAAEVEALEWAATSCERDLSEANLQGDHYGYDLMRTLAQRICAEIERKRFNEGVKEVR